MAALKVPNNGWAKIMEDGNYIYPSELAILITVMLLPALMVALVGQFWFLHRHGISALRTGLSLFATVLISTVLTTLLLLVAPDVLHSALEMRELSIGPIWFPVLPLAFIVVALVTSVVSFLASRRV